MDAMAGRSPLAVLPDSNAGPGKGPQSAAAAAPPRAPEQVGPADSNRGAHPSASLSSAQAGPQNPRTGWVSWRENGKTVLAEREGAGAGGDGESDDGEDCEITAVTHVSDPVASLDLRQVRGGPPGGNTSTHRSARRQQPAKSNSM